MKKYFTSSAISLVFILLSSTTSAQPFLDIVFVASGFTEPVDIASAGDERLFIVERNGKIKILYPDNTNSLFLDIDARVGSLSGEQGLLGLTFHPDYASNGYFYVNYTNNDGDTRISRFSVSASDEDIADPDSEFNLLAIDQPAANHNGGDMNFGPDGYLHCALGNGGGPGNGNSQDTSNLLGKILRIDVDGGAPYAVPADNPYVETAGADELWNYGLRNPWRFSFDALTGDMWIADVGGESREEVNFQFAASTGGENYAWRCYEGKLLIDLDNCNEGAELTLPIFDYPHDFSGGFAVTGGFVYRGTQFPHLYGHYIFTDYITGNTWSIYNSDTGFTTIAYGVIENDLTSFGENNEGEIYACNNNNGFIYHVVDLCGNLSAAASVTNNAAPTTTNGAINLTVSGGTSPYTFSWSNGATTEDISTLAAGDYTVTVSDAIGCEVTETFTVMNNCRSATGVTITGITSTSVTISWNNTGALSYKVMYVSAGGIPTLVNTSSTSVTLTGLTPATFYNLRIKNKCPGAPGNFTTNGNFNTAPLRENETYSAELSVFPNPNNGTFIVQNAENVRAAIIYDMAGKDLGSL
ncbi:MAG: PQQ-dependent sugar dehydrogenase, partial [Chitinophagales bacterium]|nr:PQQ-dependent sugar dehydrogenase [Chitinophagales bacterium]